MRAGRVLSLLAVGALVFRGCAIEPSFADASGSNGTVYGQYRVLPLNLYDGQSFALQLDQFGNLKVDVVAGGSGSSTPTGTPGNTTASTSAVPVMGFDNKALASDASAQSILTAVGKLLQPGGAVLNQFNNSSGTATTVSPSAPLPVTLPLITAAAPIYDTLPDAPIAIQSTVSMTTVSGTPTAATSSNSYTYRTNGAGTISLDLGGITASGGGVTFYASDTGQRFFPISPISGAANAGATTATVDGSYTFSPGGRQYIRIAVTAAGTSGTLSAGGDATWTTRLVSAEQARGPWSTTDTNGGTSPSAATQPTGGAGILGWLGGIYQAVTGTLKVADPNNAPYVDWPAITPSSGTYTVPSGTKSLAVICTTAGTVTLTSAAGNSISVPIAVGYTLLPYVPATFTLPSGAATFGALR